MPSNRAATPLAAGLPESAYRATIMLDYADGCIRVTGFDGNAKDTSVTIRVGGENWILYEWRDAAGRLFETQEGTTHPSSIYARARKIEDRIPARPVALTWQERLPSGTDPSAPPGKPVVHTQRPAILGWFRLPREIKRMAEDIMKQRPAPAAEEPEVPRPPNPDLEEYVERERRKLAREDARRAEIERRIQEAAAKARAKREEKARLAKEFLERQQRDLALREAAERNHAPPPIPEIPIHFAPVVIPGAPRPAAAITGLAAFRLLQRASLLWVSNQTDDLLCLPHCHIEHLDYQCRTALKVLGPMRGRALLSDEVGLGKTIEAGLVLKECLTRGMVRRFLVLTMPSLVDQWREEFESKFGITAATTHSESRRDRPEGFWRENEAIIASLHTLKQEAHLEHACARPWDLLIVDEAHHLRNPASKAWQAVNRLPRQFLLLLTATPVQNSLEELYHLITLLQPGQFPPPREFRERFIDKQRPRQPKAPDELRRMLNQVMIRNTRANAGIDLPARRAETVLFQPDETEAEFHEKWESELRASLAALPAPHSSLRGRMLLQAIGSSPAAWRKSMQSYPDKAFTQKWLEVPVKSSVFREKLKTLPPLARAEGGLVVFTQFRATQDAIADALKDTGTAVRVIHGEIPAPDRQPITDAFRRDGGILVLTRSGTEGRNLQFCHRLVNFDLPWNPMEIEQRIGRLHRIGQTRPVEIYNFVQARSLQAMLLDLLQEKLNLFELVVGETGLILGDRFSSDDLGEEIFRCWREAPEDVAGALARLGDDVAKARADYGEIQELDSTLFASDYETV